jgi:phosphate transport system permease protein
LADSAITRGRTGPIDLEVLKGSPARLRKERTVARVFQAAAALSIAISAAIIASLVFDAFDFLRVRFSLDDISSLWSSTGWFPRRGAFDVKTIVAGTMVVSIIAMIVATPLGLGAAMYLSEYANPRLRRWLKPILEILASLPSVVLGFFALTWISPEIVQAIWGNATLFNMMAAGIAVGVLITPLVASVAEDALRAVPHALREASYGMGARKRTTTLRVVFPAGISGIVAALILGVSRAIGETMIVAIVAGATAGSAFTLDPTGTGQTMTAAMTSLAIGSDQVRGQEGTFESLYFVGLLLFFMTLALNIASERFVRRVRQTY